MGDSTIKGDIGVAKITADLLVKEFEVLLPYSPGSPFDLVAYKDNKFYKVQCKYRKAHNGIIVASFKRMTVNYRKQESRPLQESEMDVLAVYCPDTDICYYISFLDCQPAKGKFHLRIAQPKNGQVQGVRFAQDFTDTERAFRSL